MSVIKSAKEVCGFPKCGRVMGSPVHINHEETYFLNGTFCGTEGCHSFVGCSACSLGGLLTDEAPPGAGAGDVIDAHHAQNAAREERLERAMELKDLPALLRNVLDRFQYDHAVLHNHERWTPKTLPCEPCDLIEKAYARVGLKWERGRSNEQARLAMSEALLRDDGKGA